MLGAMICNAWCFFYFNYLFVCFTQDFAFLVCSTQDFAFYEFKLCIIEIFKTIKQYLSLGEE
jgi:hypothetical protein